MDILNSSPFGQFFNIETTLKMDRYIIQDVLHSYNIGRNKFTVGGHSFCFSSEEACVLLGLPLTGNSVNLSNCVGSCDLRSNYLSSTCPPTRDQLFLGAKKAIEKSDVDNTARLLLLFLFSTCLFPAANSSTPHVLFEYVSDLSGLWTFKWGDEVFQYLICSVRHAAQARQSGKRSVTLHGCSLLILAMVYSRSGKPGIYCEHGLSPRILNLDFSHTWRSLAKLKPFIDLSLNILSYEEWLFGGASSRPST